MAIGDKTRKILWAKSGGRCAICKRDLFVQDDGFTSNIGEECHIVSAKVNGPRHRNMNDYDTPDNIIILCRNHHKIIDTDISQYPEEKLIRIKKQHELWVKQHTKINDNKQDVILFSIMKHVVDIVRALDNVEGVNVEYPHDKEEDYNLFADFKEWIDNFDVWEDYDEFKKIELIKPSIDALISAGYSIYYANTNVELMPNSGNYGEVALFEITTKEEVAKRNQR